MYLGFSRGAGGFGFSNFIDIFYFCFRSTKLNYRALTNHYKDLILSKFSAPQAKLGFFEILKKQDEKGVLGTFWKILTKKSRFFGARFPLNFCIYWRQKRLQKKLKVRLRKMEILK